MQDSVPLKAETKPFSKRLLLHKLDIWNKVDIKHQICKGYLKRKNIQTLKIFRYYQETKSVLSSLKNPKFIKNFQWKPEYNLPFSLSSIDRNQEAFRPYVSSVMLNILRKTTKVRFLEISNLIGWKGRGLISAIKSLRRLRLLEKVTLDFNHNDQIDELKALVLSQSMKRLSKIKTLSLNLLNCKKGVNQGLQILINNLPFFNSLEELDLTLSLKVRDKHFISNLAQQMSQAKLLQKVSFNFTYSRSIRSATLRNLFESINTLWNLRSLHLQLNSAAFFNAQEMSFLSDTLAECSELEDLKLIFHDCQFLTDDGIHNLCQSLCMMTELKQLNLSFYKCSNLSDESLQLLSVPIGNLVELESLTLCFQKSMKELQDGIIQLSKSFANLSDLKKFQLSLDWCTEIPDKGLIELARSIREMTLLESFHISLRECSNKSMVYERILDSLSACPHLQILKLNFPKCAFFGNEAILKLGMTLPKLESLNELSVNLSYCRGFTPETFGSVATSLGTLKKLNMLKLKLEKLDLKDEQCYLIAKAISEAPCLRTFDLDLNKCDYFTDNGINEIRNGITQHRSLKFVTINLFMCARITNLSKTKLVNLCNEQTQLWSYNLIL